jgi:putative ABC transport system permease protein
MMHNYLKIAVRNLQKKTSTNLINIAGLAVGMACCLLIVLYIRRERGMDAFHADADRIFRVLLHVKMANGELKLPTVPPAVAPSIVAESNKVEAFARVWNTGEMTVRTHPDKVFYEEGIFADSAFLSMFSFPILTGAEAANALKSPGNIVISAKMADRYFPGQMAVGQVLMLDAKRPYTVSAVMQNVPDNSHLQFSFVLPWTAIGMSQSESGDDNWGWAGPSTFLKLTAASDRDMVEGQLPAMLKKHLEEGRANRFSLHLQSLRDIYFGSADYRRAPAAHYGDMRYLQLFSWLAALILAIACINFMNLSTARATERAREVGMRKSVGATKSQLVGQFLAEGMLMSAIAFCLALGLAALAVPFTASVFGTQLHLNFMEDPALIGIFLGIALTTGLLAGAYPAFVLASFRPIEVLKNHLQQNKAGLWLRKCLVVTQFTASVALAVASIVVYRQMAFMQAQNPGFDKSQVLVLPLKGNNMGGKLPLLKSTLSRNPAVQSLAFGSNAFDGSATTTSVTPEGAGEADVRQVALYSVDDQWLQTTGVRLLAGRFFSAEFPADTFENNPSILINESAAREFGFGSPEMAIGKHVAALHSNSAKIVGVVSDFNFNSMRTAIEPMLFFKRPQDWGNLFIRLQGGNPAAVLASLKTDWAQVFSEYPFDYYFLDSHLAELYKTEKRVSRLSNLATGLALFIAALGLFGLAMFMAEQRRKEIGVRKVLGASVAGITGLLTKDFLKLVIVAILIASPIAYFFMKKWLSDFAYRIEMEWWMFAGAGLAALLIAFLTVGFQSVKAALANPTRSLRSE